MLALFATPLTSFSQTSQGDAATIALLRERPAYARAVLVTGAVDLDELASIARGCCADLRERPITVEAQDALCALVASYLPPETA